MNQQDKEHQTVGKLRDWLSDNLNIDAARKEEVYLDICDSVSLRDVSYWIEVIFAAGIATVGLVLNSPAVIIGAMLISPLMGSILGNGLALAAGDVILALRAIIKLALSCLVAILFAVFLVSVLPFKEMTPEILARTQPNILDLVVALFSGAVGSLAVCKKPKGVATSIPGVAIAVALMPPLCVVGYGFGIALSVNMVNGLRVASGGGLLFFTNLVAITFTAMTVFLALHIDSVRTKQKIREWRRKYRETVWVKNILEIFPQSKHLKKFGSLPGRFILIVFTILTILIPLYKSFIRLRQEIVIKQQENNINSAVRSIWLEEFASSPNGKPRSFISQVSTRELNQKLKVQLQIFTSELYTPGEQNYFVELLAKRLNKPSELVSLNLIEIPTAQSKILTAIPEEEPPEPIITVAELQANFLQEVKSALLNLKLPPPAKTIDYEVINSPNKPMAIRIIYLSDRDIDKDAQVLLANEIRQRLNYPSTKVSMKRIAVTPGKIDFQDKSIILTPQSLQTLDNIVSILQQQPALRLKIIANQKQEEALETSKTRAKVIKEYLELKWKIDQKRIIEQLGEESQANAILTVTSEQ
ncbi:TIGR00341 family protein [Calothrix sp. CCY 0018]|uniref:TIGR00341 family protein n=1 Tax=Calothrix sp. CCY 0018 TaxID=3103864 RepID=UPI0039C7325F